ncbi:SNARE-associated protein Snapin-like isoform X1 [Ptychodera flava]|uniref:SNARE-associated protein Snapin-like isoform X1 n=1 Tax=Ptychodera flava TaxID=63121 RepID=UPI00396A1459
MATAETSASPVESPSSTKSFDPQTRDALAEGLLDLLKPAVEEVDEQVARVRESQVELRQQIDGLADELKKLSDEQPLPVELDVYVKKLMNSRRRIMVVNNILQNAQTRMDKLNSRINAHVAKRKSTLDALKGEEKPPNMDYIHPYHMPLQ